MALSLYLEGNKMAISTRLYDYLNTNDIKFDTIAHNPTFNSVSTAIAVAIPPQQVAKAVILQDHEGRFLMAVLPASHKLNMGKLSDDLSRSLRMAKEQQVYSMFNDCENGAVPPLGQSYNMDMVYDDALTEQRDVYLEGGDHATLVHMMHDDFNRLMAGHWHSRFSAEVFH
jgi:Ala-tRNA(Pro) deacylase